MKTTMTLADIRSHGPCADGWRKLLDGLVTDDMATVVDLRDILRINGSRDAWWATRCLPRRERVALAVVAARTVSHLHPQAAATLDVCDRWLAGTATEEEMGMAAADAAMAAAMAARAAKAAADAAMAMAAADAAMAAAMAAMAARAEPMAAAMEVVRVVWDVMAESEASWASWESAREAALSSLGDLMRQWCDEQEAAR